MREFYHRDSERLRRRSGRNSCSCSGTHFARSVVRWPNGKEAKAKIIRREKINPNRPQHALKVLSAGRGNFPISGQVDAAISSLLSTSAISPYLPLRASSRSELQNLLRVVPAARQHLCPDVSVFDQTDRTPGWYHEFICPSPSTCQTIHQAQLGAPVQDTHEVCGRRCFLPFALIRRPPTSDILIAVCRVAFAHVIAVDHRRPGSWSLVE